MRHEILNVGWEESYCAPDVPNDGRCKSTFWDDSARRSGVTYGVESPPLMQKFASSLSQAKIVEMSALGLGITVVRYNLRMRPWLGDREGPTHSSRSWLDRAASDR